MVGNAIFLSTLSLRRATFLMERDGVQYYISIHALLAESDQLLVPLFRDVSHFYPRSPCGERQFKYVVQCRKVIFLSTLSLRRATNSSVNTADQEANFYPRSPCGERPIHPRLCNVNLNFYPRSPCGERQSEGRINPHKPNISIHALLAESDLMLIFTITAEDYFYPRSPCGERRPYSLSQSVKSLYFYPRSPCGERRLHR